MRTLERAALLGLLILGGSVAPSTAQGVGFSRPTLAPHEMEEFLLHARIVATRNSPRGVTEARRVTMSDGETTHDAQVQDVDVYRPLYEVPGKYAEINFRDSYRYNIAAYRLALLLGLDDVPMSVERIVDGKPAAVTWWIDDVAMDEGTRQSRNLMGPDPSRTAGQTLILRVFDELIENRDRNAGNLLWTTDWKMWMIDHTRAFRLDHQLMRPEKLVRCERSLFEHLRGLTTEAVARAMGTALLDTEIAALIARRDALVRLFDDQIARSGERRVLYTLPPAGPAR
jgi:hypothetical protein